MKKNLLFAALACLGSLQAYAYDFKTNGVCYNITDSELKECKVTANPDLYRDALSVPAAVLVDEVMYRVVGIEDRAFKGCTGLTTVMVADGVKTIGEKAFAGCSSLTSIVLPQDLSTISYALFDECVSLVNFPIPEAVKVVEGFAFNGCQKLQAVSFPNSVDSIGENIFYGCPSLKGILVGKTPAKVTANTFDRFFSFKNVTLYVPYGSKPAYKEAEYWSNFSKIYESGKDITDMYLEPSALSLNEGETATLALTVTPVEAAGVTVTWTSSNPLVATVSQTGVVSAKTAGEAIITAASADVSGRTAVCAITVKQSGSKTVIAYTTNDAEAVTVNDPAVFKASNGASVNILSNTYKDGLGLIVFDGVIAEIGEAAFTGAQTLTSISIPSGVTTLGDRSFQRCINLKDVKLPSTLTTLGSKAFADCTALPFIAIPSSVTTLPYGVFNECYGLKNVDLAHGLTKIKDYAFYGTALKAIDIPSTVTVIDEFAFYSCKSLTTVRVGSTPAMITSTSFNQNKTKMALEVPYGAKEAYQSANYWKEFTKVLEYGEIGVTAVKISQEYLALMEGETAKLTARIEPSELSSLSITWSSSDPKVAVVDANGNVTALSYGSANIIATASDASQTSGSCLLVVTRKPVPVTGIALSRNTLAITEGETAVLSVAIDPADASNKEIKWTSSNTEVAIVVDGVITAVAPGNATVTVTTQDGTNLSDVCEVTVSPIVSLSEISAEGAGNEYYQLDGTRTKQLKQGMNVVRKANGSVAKVYVK